MSKLLSTVIVFMMSVLAVIGQTSWGRIDYTDAPWVRNDSRPYDITHGLEGRHLVVWASHGRYYSSDEARWKWQRPPLFTTCEDLFTPTIVVPFLLPMLEDAGAVVYSPRERDWQRHEVIVDNDNWPDVTSYNEKNYKHEWRQAPKAGFAFHEGVYHNGENPFIAGTARMVETTQSRNKVSTVSYQPNLPEAGRYAVYVSYQTVPGSVSDAHYTVWHKGQKTDFLVNQKMGGETWVYLGTFDFDAGSSILNQVVLTNQSREHGMVTADAVRFGGGMGNIERGGTTSGLARCFEAARYSVQWAGMPDSIYNLKGGLNDYADDINSRSLSSNMLCGGSVYAPDSTGRKVPFELSLAVHSDAGHTETGEGVYGSLSICTTQKGDSLLAAGVSRQMSKEFATDLLNNLTSDIQKRFGTWTQRDLYDRNYSETRLPVVPSAIIETMSHQNFGDMRFGQDPNFRFTLARSLYKTIAHYVARKHNKTAHITPLAPINFRVEFTGKESEIQLTWAEQKDICEPTATTDSYILYVAQDDGGFDNGTVLGANSCTMKLRKGVLYSFKVCALNHGGRSFPSQVMCALYQGKEQKTILIADGFHRLSSPAQLGQGFDLDYDAGVSYGRTAGFIGCQRVFDTNKIGVEDSTGLGYSTNELQGTFIAGNDFNYVRTHADAVKASGKYNVVSCSSETLGLMSLNTYAVIDLALGLECDDGHSLVYYKSMTPAMQHELLRYVSNGGALFVSGAYVGSDMQQPEERQFLECVMKFTPGGSLRLTDNLVGGLGMTISYHHQLNEHHYAATTTDILLPTSDSFAAMAYSDGNPAAVAYPGTNFRSFVMGFPFETIIDTQQRNAVMKGILSFLINN